MLGESLISDSRLHECPRPLLGGSKLQTGDVSLWYPPCSLYVKYLLVFSSCLGSPHWKRQKWHERQLGVSVCVDGRWEIAPILDMGSAVFILGRPDVKDLSSLPRATRIRAHVMCDKKELYLSPGSPSRLLWESLRAVHPLPPLHQLLSVPREWQGASPSSQQVTSPISWPPSQVAARLPFLLCFSHPRIPVPEPFKAAEIRRLGLTEENYNIENSIFPKENWAPKSSSFPRLHLFYVT